MRKRLILGSMSSVLLMVCFLQKGSRYELLSLFMVFVCITCSIFIAPAMMEVYPCMRISWCWLLFFKFLVDLCSFQKPRSLGRSHFCNWSSSPLFSPDVIVDYIILNYQLKSCSFRIVHLQRQRQLIAVQTFWSHDDVKDCPTHQTLVLVLWYAERCVDYSN